MTDRAATEPHPWTRRRWLGGASFACLGVLGAAAPVPRPTVDSAQVDAIRRRLKAAGLENVGASQTEHYFATGDAPDDYRDGALGVCEGLARTFQKTLLTRGITIELPPKKMGVVVLAGRSSYEAFKGDEAGGSEGGLFDVEANRLVIFQSTNEQVNTFTLVHEATHQLTYNTGLLSRQADVPVAVSEGFATYGEVWRKARPRVGDINAPRLGVLRNPAGGGPRWIPIARLLTEDQLFEDENTHQVAYAESWLFIYDLFRTTAGVKSLQAYLASVRKRRDPGHRLEDAENAFGRLDRLDAGLRLAAKKLR